MKRLLLHLHCYLPFNRINLHTFFVLDEIDASLDNANVSRVVRYIKRLSQEKQAQFLVISLKQLFFSTSNSLVGVYRDVEECTSKILTLRLDDYPEK